MHLLIGLIGLALIAFIVSRLRASRGRGLALVGATNPYEREISAREFDEMVIDTSHRTPVLVDFYADWCGPCRAFSPILSEFAKICDGSFLLAKIDVEKNKALAAKHRVASLPTVALFRDGERIDGFSGGRLPHSLRYFLAKNGVDVPDDAEADEAAG